MSRVPCDNRRDESDNDTDMSAHNGKIGRLPGAIREQLNQRLADGEPARTALPWLNALPEVQSVLAAQFAGQPVSETNLSRWRTGGYQLWLQEQERRAIVRQLSAEVQPDEVKAQAEELGATLSKSFSTVFLADFALASRDVLLHLEDPLERLHRIRGILRTLSQQRRQDYLAKRLTLDQARCERECLEELAKLAPLPANRPATNDPPSGELR